MGAGLTVRACPKGAVDITGRGHGRRIAGQPAEDAEEGPPL